VALEERASRRFEIARGEHSSPVPRRLNTLTEGRAMGNLKFAVTLGDGTRGR
jgi:hypothetical protein